MEFEHISVVKLLCYWLFFCSEFLLHTYTICVLSKHFTKPNNNIFGYGGGKVRAQVSGSRSKEKKNRKNIVEQNCKKIWVINQNETKILLTIEYIYMYITVILEKRKSHYEYKLRTMGNVKSSSSIDIFSFCLGLSFSLFHTNRLLAVKL